MSFSSSQPPPQTDDDLLSSTPPPTILIPPPQPSPSAAAVSSSQPPPQTDDDDLLFSTPPPTILIPPPQPSNSPSSAAASSSQPPPQTDDDDLLFSTPPPTILIPPPQPSPSAAAVSSSQPPPQTDDDDLLSFPPPLTILIPPPQPSSSAGAVSSSQPPPQTDDDDLLSSTLPLTILIPPPQPSHSPSAAAAASSSQPPQTQPPQLQPQNWKQRAKPFAIVILLQILFAIMNFLTKLAMNNGLSSYIIVTYRNILAFLVLAPFAISRERDRWSQMTWSVFWKILALSVLGPIMDQELYFLGMKYTTATLASALCNTLPGITFALACITRRETINITARASQAKILGTVLSLLGATVMTLVKGPILFGTVGSNSNKHHHDSFHTTLGVVFILLSTLSSAVSNILQTITLSEIDLPLTVTSLISLFGSIEAIVVAVVMNRKEYHSVWSIFKWDIKLLSAIYAGIFCSGLGFYLRGQVMHARGPVFGTMFNPVCMILVAMSGYLFLNEQQLLGRVIGALIIVGGLYIIVWGTNKDNNLRRQAQERQAQENANA